MSEQKQVTISQIREDLKNGLDRKEIKKKYGLKGSNANEIFKHPKLAGLRVNRKPEERVVLVDDVADEAPKVRRVAAPTTELVDDTVEASTPVVETPIASTNPEPIQVEAAPASVVPEPTQPVVVETPVTNGPQAEEAPVTTQQGVW